MNNLIFINILKNTNFKYYLGLVFKLYFVN